MFCSNFERSNLIIKKIRVPQVNLIQSEAHAAAKLHISKLHSQRTLGALWGCLKWKKRQRKKDPGKQMKAKTLLGWVGNKKKRKFQLMRGWFNV